LATLLWDPKNVHMGGLFSFGGPSQEALLRFGATGVYPTWGLGRWWTLLSAGWLHGGVMHIAFCLYWVRFLVPETAELYGIGRTVILYTWSSAFAFALSSVVPMFPFIGGAY